MFLPWSKKNSRKGRSLLVVVVGVLCAAVAAGSAGAAAVENVWRQCASFPFVFQEGLHLTLTKISKDE